MARRRKRESFLHIYNDDGTCSMWECGEDGVVLAFDEFSPECAEWFCEFHWREYHEIFRLVEDHRKPKNPPHIANAIYEGTYDDAS